MGVGGQIFPQRNVITGGDTSGLTEVVENSTQSDETGGLSGLFYASCSLLIKIEIKKQKLKLKQKNEQPRERVWVRHDWMPESGGLSHTRGSGLTNIWGGDRLLFCHVYGRLKK